MQKEHAKEESKNRRLRIQLENYQVPEVNDYVLTKDFLYNLQKEVKVWERKVEIAEVTVLLKWHSLKSVLEKEKSNHYLNKNDKMALKTNKQAWTELKSSAHAHDTHLMDAAANKLPSIQSNAYKTNQLAF